MSNIPPVPRTPYPAPYTPYPEPRTPHLQNPSFGQFEDFVIENTCFVRQTYPFDKKHEKNEKKTEKMLADMK